MGLISSDFMFKLLGILVAVTIAVSMYLKYVVYNFWKNNGIDQAEPVVPFGDMWPIVAAKKSIGQAVRDLYLHFKDSPVFGFYAFYKPLLVVRDPDLIRWVLTKNFANFQDRGTYLDEEVEPISGHLFSLPGDRWKNLRAKFTPTFTSGKMKHMFFTVKECSDNLAKCLTNEMKKNEVIEIKEFMARFSTDVIASVAFGVECNSLENPDAEFRYWGRDFLQSKPIKNLLIFLCPSLLKMLKVQVVDKKMTDFFINTFKNTVEYRTANKVVRKDFLDQVMQLIHKGYVKGDDGEDTPSGTDCASGKITMNEGAAQVFIFWLAGFETSSSAATHCLYELALNQDVQDKLAEEIIRVLEEYGDLTYDSLNAMPYLHKVISETLRKYPSLPTLNRACTEDIDLPGTPYRVTKGTPVIIPVWGIHYDPDIYPEPDKFDPERFSAENIASRHRYAYLPFGEGPRNCIGMRFGILQVKMGLVSLLSKFRFEVTPQTPVPLKFDTGNFLLVTKDGVSLRIKQR